LHLIRWSLIRTLRVLAVAVAVSCGRPRPSPNHRPPNQRPGTVLLRIRLPAGFKGSPSTNYLLTQLMRNLPPTRDSIPGRQDIARIVFEQYGPIVEPTMVAGESRTYDLIDSSIRVLNDLAPDSFALPAGRVLLPTIPASGFKRGIEPGTYVPAVGAGLLVARDAAHIDTAGASIAAFAIEPTWRNAPNASRTRALPGVIDVSVPFRFRDSIYQDAGELFAQGLLDFEQSFDVNFLLPPQAAAPARKPWSVLLVDSLRKSVQGSIRQLHVPLLVLDSGWPDESAFRESKRELRDLMSLARAAWGIPPYRSPNDTVSFRKPHYPHVVKVAAAVQELISTVAPGAVDVMYVPLSRDQGATSILRELLVLSQLLEEKKAAVLGHSFCGLNRSDPASIPRCAAQLQLDPNASHAAEVFADSILDLLPDSFPPSAIVNRVPAELLTNTTLLSAAWDVLDASVYDLSRPGGFISLSWITDPLSGWSFNNTVGSNAVFVVAAAGNDREIVDGTDTWVDLAGRSVMSRYLLAVLNVTVSGDTTCGSSFVDAGQLAQTNVVGYDGLLADGSCGTSFATPRVAWLLATGEALQTSPRSASTWVGHLLSRIESGRTGTTTLRETLFQPFTYLTAK
jgi:hypothetical protein